ncbi:MAG: glycosyltransferase family 4 protein [Chloroflexi bacterium]|nr:glycosyltransferase family 4 protein [Chloroflexota bacterium]
MKKILLISRCPPVPLHLGDRLIIWHLARELSRRGYTIDLLALYDRADDPTLQDRYAAFFRHVELIPEAPRAPLKLLRRLIDPAARFTRRAEASFCPPLWRSAASYLARFDYDLVHCFGAVSVYDLQPLFAHMPSVITPYESHTLYLQSAARQGDLQARLRQPIARRFEGFMFSPYDRTVVISEADRAMLLSLQPALRVDVIPNGIELERFQARHSGRDEATLLFVGNYDYAPNQDAARLLVERILPEVRAASPAAKLQLVGVNPTEWMRALAEDHIEVTGPAPDVAPYLARATVFVCPLRIGAGLKNKVLEALAMGTPVVATPLSMDGIHARNGESAIVAPVDAIAQETLRLLKDEALRKRLSLNGRELIETQYSWEKTATSYETLYDEICRLRLS